MIAFHCCDGFCQTSTWISPRHTLSPPSWTPLPSPTASHPLGCLRALVDPLCHTENSHCPCISRMVMYVSMPLPQFLPPSLPPLYPQACSLCLCLHCHPVNRFISTVWPNNLLPHMYPEKTIIARDAYTPLFVAALFTIARTWKQPRCLSTD